MKNYHTHTWRCKHATGDIEDYVEKALEAGGKVLGFSDHTPLPDGRWSHIRMGLKELPNYLNAIEDARKKYPEIRIVKGLEGEYLKEYHGFYEEEILGVSGIEYLVGGVHWFPYHGSFHEMEDLRTGAHLKGYADAVIKTIESGLFSFIAHPDLFGVAWKKWDEDSKACSRDILEAAVETDTPLEVNGYGFRKKKVITKEGQRPPYPWVPFWELASTYSVKVVFSSDAHDPGDVFANRDECLELIHTRGLTLADLPF